jgi:hypothetical protein
MEGSSYGAPPEFLTDRRVQAFAAERGLNPEEVWAKSNPTVRNALMRAVRGELDGPKPAVPMSVQDPPPQAVPRGERAPTVGLGPMIDPPVGTYPPQQGMPPRRSPAPPDTSGVQDRPWQEDVRVAAGRAGDALSSAGDLVAQAGPAARDAFSTAQRSLYDALPDAPERPAREPDEFDRAAQGYAGVLPGVVGWAGERLNDAGELIEGGVKRGVAAGQSAVGAGLSVFGAPEAGADLMRSASRMQGEAGPADPPPVAAAAEGDPAPAAKDVAPKDKLKPPAPPAGSMSTPVQATAAAAAASAPASAEAAASMSVAPGRTTKDTYKQAAKMAEKRFMEVAAPRHFTRLMEEGRIAEAYAWKTFTESVDTSSKLNHFARAVFAVGMGDAKTAIAETHAAVAGSEIGDTYEVVEEDSGFLGENDDMFARFSFRNKKTGETFTRSFASMPEMVNGLAAIASPEAAFESIQQRIQDSVAEIKERARDDEEARIDLTKFFFENIDTLFAGEQMGPEEKQELAMRLAGQTVRANSLGTLGLSHGGGRNESVPSVGAP